MAELHPYIQFLGGLPQFEIDHRAGTAVEMRTGAVVSKYNGSAPHHAHCLAIVWPGQSSDQPVLVSATKYVPLQVTLATRRGPPPADWLAPNRHIFTEAGEAH